MPEGEKPSLSVPSELRISKKWDFAVEQFIRQAGMGFLAAGIASLVLFSKPS
jgi:hypothetical protein